MKVKENFFNNKLNQSLGRQLKNGWEKRERFMMRKARFIWFIIYLNG